MGKENYTNVQLMTMIAEHDIRITPDVTVSGATGDSNIGTALLASMLQKKNGGNG